jgi:hypothetical protein
MTGAFEQRAAQHDDLTGTKPVQLERHQVRLERINR